MSETSMPIRIDTLASLRFLGIMLIVLHHLSATIPWQAPGLGDIGTTFFFVLSGFVLPLGSARFASPGDSLRFLWSRIVRIYPIHLLTFVATIPLLLALGWPISIDLAVINLLLVQSWFHSSSVFFSFNALSWFLSTLLFCYVVYSAVMLRPSIFMPLALVVSLLSLVASVCYVEREATDFGQEVTIYFMHIFPPNRLFMFLCGMAGSFAFRSVLYPLRARVGTAFATVLEILVMVGVVENILFRALPRAIIKGLAVLFPGLKYTSFYLVENYIVIVFLAIMIFWVFGLERGLISRILRCQQFLFLGKISFCIYLSHQLIFRYMAGAREILVSAFGQVVVGAVACVIVLGVSFLMHKYVEEPMRRRLTT